MIGAAAALLLAAAFQGSAGLPQLPESDVSDAQALARWYEHGRCLVRTDRTLAERILATRPESIESFEAFTRADGPARCFQGAPSGQPRLHTNATRGAIVEALLLADFSAVGVPRRRRAAPIVDLSSGADRWSPGQVRAVAFLRLAECVVQIDPSQSFALFSEPVGSPGEETSIRTLVPAIEQCLPPDLQMTLVPSALRSYLAEGAYRVSVVRMQGAR